MKEFGDLEDLAVLDLYLFAHSGEATLDPGMPHVHLKLDFGDGARLWYQDIRRFGMLRVVPLENELNVIVCVNRSTFWESCVSNGAPAASVILVLKNKLDVPINPLPLIGSVVTISM